MNETEEMERHSDCQASRMKWAINGNSENMMVFHNRMLGVSDDGKRVLGKTFEELPDPKNEN